MLVNTTTLVPSIYLALRDMENSSFEFFLTGSRFFGGCRAQSDYDFFVLEGKAVEDYLHDMSFVTDEDFRYANDPTFVKVMTLRLCDGEIQVQLIKSEEFARKQLVQRLLSDRYGKRGLPGDKDVKRELWQLAYHVVRLLGIS